jgi:hypothetical protein
VGLTGTCGGALDEATRFQISLSGAGLRTDLHFDGTTRRLEEASTAVAFTYRPSAWSFQASLGVIVTGTIEGGGVSDRIEPGFLASASVGYTLVDGEGPRPYVGLSATVGVATAATHAQVDATNGARFTALDLRLAAVVGKRLFGFWMPYAGASVFGGPISFRGMNGQDAHHYRLSVGSSFTLPAHLELFVEVGVLGEQNLLGGLGWAF